MGKGHVLLFPWREVAELQSARSPSRGVARFTLNTRRLTEADMNE
jgi:hypothetical protein